MGRTLFPLIDCLKLRPFRDEMTLAHRLIWAVARTGSALVVGALRRQAADLLHGVKVNASAASTGDKAAIDKPSNKDAN